MIAIGYIALWIATAVGGVYAHQGETWGWFLCIPGGAVLLLFHGSVFTDRMRDIFRPGEPFFSPNQFIAFKGYVCGLATGLAFWGFSVDGWAGRAMQAVASLTILWASFEGSFGRRRQ